MDDPYAVFPTSSSRRGGGAANGQLSPSALPVNILNLIISHLDDPVDVLRLTRTSRLFYFLTLPKLYDTVTLRSYGEVRRKDGRVEGLGGGSPFSMALSALATSQGASAVKTLKLEGAWQEMEEYYNLGRVPDATVLLSVAVRSSIDRMFNLRSFIWEMEIKPLRQIYHGLSARSTLRSFTLTFPNCRTPRPIAVVPAMPSLEALKVTNLDPLCSNDDISQCLLGSKNLRTLKLHFSPRMRLMAESSSNLNDYFGKCIEAGYKMSIENLGLQNFYGPNRGQLYFAMKQESMVNTEFLDMFGGAHGNRPNVFIDETWKRIPPQLNFKWKMHRSNEMAMQHTRILAGFSGLEELYLVNKTLSLMVSESASPASVASEPSPSVLPGADLANLGKEYLNVILKQHGATLRSLLFFDKFDFDANELSAILTRCPNLQQLGLALSGNENTFRNLIPALPPSIAALRLLDNPLFRRLGVTHQPNLGEVCKDFGRQLYAVKNTSLRYLGLAEHVFRIVRPPGDVEDADRYELVPVGWDDVAHLGIWGMDNLSL